MSESILLALSLDYIKTVHIQKHVDKCSEYQFAVIEGKSNDWHWWN